MSLASLLSSPIKSRKAKSVDDPPIQTLVPPPDQPDSAKAEMMRQILLQRVRQRDGSPEGFRQVTPADAEAFIAAIAPDDPRGLNQEMPETGRPDWQREALGNALQQDLAGQNSFTPRASDNPYPKELGQLLKDPNKFSTGTAEVSIPITMGAKPTMGEQTQRDVQTPYRDPVTPFRDDRTQFQKLRNDYEVMMNSPVEDNDKGVWGRIKEALGNALYGIGQGYQQMRASGQPATWQGMLGGAVGGIGGGVANPKWDEQRRREGELNQLKGKLADAMQLEQFQNEQDTARVNRQKAQADIINQANTNARNSLKDATERDWYDPKNPAHQEAMRRAGLDPTKVPAWDNRKQDQMEIAGVMYVRNNNTGVYEQANIPGNQGVDYVVKDAFGNTKTFRVSVRDAAKFTADANALMWTLKERQADRDSREREGEKDRLSREQIKQMEIDYQRERDLRDAAKEREKMAIDAATKAAAAAEVRKHEEEMIRLKTALEE